MIKKNLYILFALLLLIIISISSFVELEDMGVKPSSKTLKQNTSVSKCTECNIEKKISRDMPIDLIITLKDNKKKFLVQNSIKIIYKDITTGGEVILKGNDIKGIELFNTN